MATQRVLVHFLNQESSLIVALSGKWVTKQQHYLTSQYDGDEADNPLDIRNYKGIVDATSPHRGLWVWEGDLDDINLVESSVTFDGEWRPPNDLEIEALRRGWEVWPEGFETMSRHDRLQRAKTIQGELLQLTETEAESAYSTWIEKDLEKILAELANTKPPPAGAKKEKDVKPADPA
jgi:hypothetical protein